MRVRNFLFSFIFLFTVVAEETVITDGHHVNFSEIQIAEFIKFVSKIGKKTFIFNAKDLDFKVSYLSGRPTSSEVITSALKQILYQHHFTMKEEDGCVVIEKMSEGEIRKKLKELYGIKGGFSEKEKLSHLTEDYSKGKLVSQGSFHIYKLQYHQGSEIIKVIKQMAGAYKGSKGVQDFQHAVESMQWIESTNSIVFSSEKEIANELEDLMKHMDKAQKQVFIEVLVIEADALKAQEFGLDWGAQGHVKDKLRFHTSNFAPIPGGNPLSNALTQTVGTASLPFIGRGFDLGVIGDLILHKGKTFITLGSLISALEKDGDVQIVLNQKIVTQDNKSSSIFVGDNIPFTGSVVQTVGAAQQTTANIEYRDVGVSLQITPLLGDSDIITLDIKEEITEARHDLRESDTHVNGIQTTKTNMVTRVHVPDQHFLVLSGMVKNSKVQRKTGIPCLGGLPWIGAAFSKTKYEKEKKNILVFVRPQIIQNFDTYDELTSLQEQLFERETKMTIDPTLGHPPVKTEAPIEQPKAK